jgi:hypothetical protein
MYSIRSLNGSMQNLSTFLTKYLPNYIIVKLVEKIVTAGKSIKQSVAIRKEVHYMAHISIYFTLLRSTINSVCAAFVTERMA